MSKAEYTQNKGDGQVIMPIKELSPLLLDCIEQGQEVVFTVTGNSMAPFLRDRRDQAVLVKVDPTALQPGDVPFYRRRNGQYVLHRIIKKDDGSSCRLWGEKEALPSDGEGIRYTMLGDAQTEEEPGIEPDQILACARAFIRFGKRWECTSSAYTRRLLFWHRLRRWRPRLLRIYYLFSCVFSRIRGVFQ